MDRSKGVLEKHLKGSLGKPMGLSIGILYPEMNWMPPYPPWPLWHKGFLG